MPGAIEAQYVRVGALFRVPNGKAGPVDLRVTRIERVRHESVYSIFGTYETLRFTYSNGASNEWSPTAMIGDVVENGS